MAFETAKVLSGKCTKGWAIKKMMGRGMGRGGGGGGEKKQKMQFIRGKTQRKKIMQKMGILILNQNYNSCRKVFQNAPNGIIACIGFENFHGKGCPRTPAHFNKAGVDCRTENKNRGKNEHWDCGDNDTALNWLLIQLIQSNCSLKCVTK